MAEKVSAEISIFWSSSRLSIILDIKDRCRKYRIPRIADNQLRDLREIRSLLLQSPIIIYHTEEISKRYESYSNHILIS